jgi:ferredoxin-NADP reductase
MALKDVKKDIEGFQEIVHEREILKKYGSDFTSYRGTVEKVIAGLHPKQLKLAVSEIHEETPSTKTFRMVSMDGNLPPFQAGQYINVFVDCGGVRTSRPYSISSSPTQTGYYDITVRRIDDGFVSSYFLDEVKVGDTLESTSPSGNFHHDPLFHGDDLVFLAGGSGITPFMSMIQETADRNLSRNMVLLYGSRTPDDIIFHDRIQAISRRHPNLSYIPVISDPPAGHTGPTGFITAELMKQVLPDMSSRTFYLCGPELMYTFCLQELQKLGIKKRKIRIEVFGPPKDVTLQPAWPAGIKSSTEFTVRTKEKTIPARAGEPLMASLERHGIVIPAQCRSGECSLCRTRLVSGKVYQPEGVRLRKSDRTFGYIHPCMAYPLEDLELLL